MVTVASSESPSAYLGSKPTARRGFRTTLPVPGAHPAQPGAVSSRPGRSTRGSPPPAPLTARWAAARAPAAGGQLGFQEAAELKARTPRGLCTHVTPSRPRGPLAWSRPRPPEQRRQALPSLPTHSSCGSALFLERVLSSRKLRPQSERTVSLASHGRLNAGGRRTCPH